MLTYRHPELIARFCKDYGIPKRAASIVFKDMLRFLWLSVWAKNQGPDMEITMFEAMSIVDEMWHSFLTFSRDYAAFSVRYFGSYLHHYPAKLLGPKRKSFAADERAKADTTVELTWKILGPRIARRWFGEYKMDYTMTRIRQLQLEAARHR